MLSPKQSSLDIDKGKEANVINGIWVDPRGEVHTYLTDWLYQQQSERKSSPLYFLWASGIPQDKKVFKWEKLQGNGLFGYLIYFSDYNDYRAFIKSEDSNIHAEYISSFENQFLLRSQKRLFEGVPFKALKRCQCHIETIRLENKDSSLAKKRIFSISFQFSYLSKPFFFVLEEMTDEGERSLLRLFNETIQKYDPDVIEGHDIFNRTLYTLSERCQQLQVPCQWGRFGQKASSYESRVTTASQSIDFIRYDIPGRTVFDTALAARMFDSITTRDCPAFDLQTVFSHLNGSEQKSLEKETLDYKKIHEIHLNDPSMFYDVQREVLNQIRTIADVLLPSYFSQLSYCPMTLQEIYLRGPAVKINLMLLEHYYHSKHSLSQKKPIKSFSGGFTHNFVEGVFRNVAHFDIVSLYPTLLLNLNRNPSTDTRNVFIPLLKKLTQQRLYYKKRLTNTTEKAAQLEYSAYASSLKVLINSFYGYLGFEGARFGDSELAAEVTSKGRELLQSLIHLFQSNGASVLEADTDGFYAVLPEEYETQTEEIIAAAKKSLPEKVDLEYRGHYVSMFCYKAKNYALFDGKKVIRRGSALRSRNTEPYIDEIRNRYIAYMLGASNECPDSAILKLRSEISSNRLPVDHLAKTEYLNQSLQTYKKKVSEGGQPHRASMEVALKINPKLKVGDKVSYYMTKKKKKQQPNWQLVEPINEFHLVKRPYDPEYYIRKLEQTLGLLKAFLNKPEKVPIQSELCLK